MTSSSTRLGRQAAVAHHPGHQAGKGSAVLDRVAQRVQHRLDVEVAEQNEVGDAPHPASLIWPLPL